MHVVREKFFEKSKNGKKKILYNPYEIHTVQFASVQYIFNFKWAWKSRQSGHGFQGVLGWRDKLYFVVLFCLQMYFSWTWKINKFEELSNRFSPEKIEGVLPGSKLTKNLCIFYVLLVCLCPYLFSACVDSPMCFNLKISFPEFYMLNVSLWERAFNWMGVIRWN